MNNEDSPAPVIQRVAHLAKTSKATKKRVAEMLASEIVSGQLPPRSKTRLTPVVLSEVERQEKLRRRRQGMAAVPQERNVLVRLYRKYLQYLYLPKHRRNEKNCRQFTMLQRFFMLQRCCVCTVNRSGMKQVDWWGDCYRRQDPPTQYAGKVLLHYDGRRYCADCLHKGQLHEGSGAPQEVAVIPALWALNRYAKRCRDLAQENYRCGNHKWAGWFSSRKSEIYGLKSQAVHHLHQEGVLQVVGHHRFGEHCAEVLRAQDYSFHRPCHPLAEANLMDLTQIEAKPAGDQEPRVIDAILAVRRYLAGKKNVSVYEWPARCLA